MEYYPGTKLCVYNIQDHGMFVVRKGLNNNQSCYYDKTWHRMVLVLYPVLFVLEGLADWGILEERDNKLSPPLN